MIAGSIEAACDFVLDWAGVEQALGDDELARDPSLPSAIRRLASRLGADWLERAHPFRVETHPGLYQSLFNIQDHILDPRKPTEDGSYRIILAENQGVWTLAVGRNDPEALYAAGDFMDGSEPGWRRFEACEVEDVLVYVLLSNLIWLSQYEDDYGNCGDERTDEIDQLVWSHAAFESFGGFWTDTERTCLHMEGVGVTLPRRSWPRHGRTWQDHSAKPRI